jgi:hypothetical protein
VPERQALPDGFFGDHLTNRVILNEKENLRLLVDQAVIHRLAGAEDGAETGRLAAFAQLSSGS